MHLRRIATLFFSLLIFTACSLDGTDDNNYREDVLDCESALSVLGACCPGFDAHAVRCEYQHEECCAFNAVSVQETLPAYSIDESNCIMNESCTTLRASGVCTRAQVADPNAQVPTGPVCP